MATRAERILADAKRLSEEKRLQAILDGQNQVRQEAAEEEGKKRKKELVLAEARRVYEELGILQIFCDLEKNIPNSRIEFDCERLFDEGARYRDRVILGVAYDYRRFTMSFFYDNNGCQNIIAFRYSEGHIEVNREYEFDFFGRTFGRDHKKIPSKLEMAEVGNQKRVDDRSWKAIGLEEIDEKITYALANPSSLPNYSIDEYYCSSQYGAPD